MIHSNLSLKQYNNAKGFSIIEVIVAIFILSFAGFGTFILVQQTLMAASLNQSRLTAFYLAQEGVEIVRNIRDTGWLQREPWPVGLIVGTWEVDFQSTALLTVASPPRSLLIDVNGFYGYAPGTTTPFSRVINITQPGTTECPTVGCFQIKVIVSWEERGKTHNVEVVNHLFNWL